MDKKIKEVVQKELNRIAFLNGRNSNTKSIRDIDWDIMETWLTRGVKLAFEHFQGFEEDDYMLVKVKVGSQIIPPDEQNK